MAANLSNAEENRLLDLSTSGAYVALYSSDPAEDDSGTEITSGSMARQAFGATAASGGAAANAAELVFPVNTGAEYTVTHVGIKSAVSGGTLRWHGPITTKAIATGDQYRVPAGDLDVSLV